MLPNINTFFDKYLKPAKDDSAEEQKVDQLHLASAALMFELCKADHNIDEEETQKISVILQNKFDLAQDTLNELYELARQEAEDATSIYQFTSLINEHYEQNAKIALISDMWEVAYADGNLDRYEEHLIRKVADLLYVSHSDFIKTKLAVKKD